MTFTQWVLSVTTCIAVIMVVKSTADRLPPPTELSYMWIDPFTVNLTWTWKPSGSSPLCKVDYKVENLHTKRIKIKVVPFNIVRCITEEKSFARWKFTIKAVPNDSCALWNESETVEKTIELPKHKELVRDFQCFFYSSDAMNCSWIPVNSSLDLRVFYRLCSEPKTPLKTCERPYSSGMRKGCYLNVSFNTRTDDFCLALSEIQPEGNPGWSNPSGMNTFVRKPTDNLKPPPPQLNVTEEGNNLRLRWTHPHIGDKGCWDYTVLYRKCDELPEELTARTGSETMSVPYDRRCCYKFQISSKTTECGKGQSDFSQVTVYDGDRPPDRPLTVVLIVIPIILSVCVILSCYCIRRHSEVICPIVPDPSVIFKEMMNGNKEAKAPAGSLYIPVPEAIDSCKITLATESSALQQHS